MFFVAGSAVAAADTISAPWTPASSGPPPDANGSGSDTKNLDVGEISDVSRPLPSPIRNRPGAPSVRDVVVVPFLFQLNCRPERRAFPARLSVAGRKKKEVALNFM